jgi:phosphopantothenoylcysteine synthetase/decarboxylase
MKLTNNEIYFYAVALKEAFTDNTQRLPMKVNFYLQKNKKILTTLGQDIEESRLEIVRHYGEPSEDGTTYSIAKDVLKDAQKELEDLLALEQEVEIYMIKADNLPDDINLTTAQMEAMLFMIE